MEHSVRSSDFEFFKLELLTQLDRLNLNIVDSKVVGRHIQLPSVTRLTTNDRLKWMTLPNVRYLRIRDGFWKCADSWPLEALDLKTDSLWSLPTAPIRFISSRYDLPDVPKWVICYMFTKLPSRNVPKRCLLVSSNPKPRMKKPELRNRTIPEKALRCLIGCPPGNDLIEMLLQMRGNVHEFTESIMQEWCKTFKLREEVIPFVLRIFQDETSLQLEEKIQLEKFPASSDSEDDYWRRS
eukprot:TRINITY_DN9308_c0_g1_i1.p1 TRINITY_DN9308_c0_g1~~TRINITY_DN9308_c0_g1_i1.p1  ORF type:complete len:239 (+),score=59.86 TRINITY_DN9308_c0_g1_i1:767-1483(+)